MNSAAVLGRAARFGGDQPRPGHAARFHLGPADLERLDRPSGGRVLRAGPTAEPLAEPDDARERVHHAEPFRGRPRHQQPAIVGAEVERGIGQAVRASPAAVSIIPAIGAPMPVHRRRRSHLGRLPPKVRNSLYACVVNRHAMSPLVIHPVT